MKYALGGGSEKAAPDPARNRIETWTELGERGKNALKPKNA